MSDLSERDVERLREGVEFQIHVLESNLADPSVEEYARAAIGAILASDWLAERDAAIRDEAKAEAWAPIRALAEKWSGCWCDTQMAHDHDPRVQDCPQHGDSSCQHMAEGITVDLRALLDGGDQCCCEVSPPEFGGRLPDRECPLHGDGGDQS